MEGVPLGPGGAMCGGMFMDDCPIDENAFAKAMAKELKEAEMFSMMAGMPFGPGGTMCGGMGQDACPDMDAMF